MDQRTQEALNRILIKEVHELNTHDKRFLRARSSYLSKDQRKKFAEVLEASPEDVKQPEPEVTQTDSVATDNPFEDQQNQDESDEVDEEETEQIG